MRKVLLDLGGVRRKLLPIGGLLTLCLIWAMGWVRADLQPGASGRWSVSPLGAQATLLGVLAIAAGGAAMLRRAVWPSRVAAGKATLVGMGLFVVPAVLTIIGGGRIDDATKVALFSLTPLFAVIFEPYLGIDAGEGGESRAGFLAAMAAIIGAFLLFPVELPRFYGAALVMLAVVATAALIAAANCAAVRLARESASLLAFATVASGSAAVVLGLLGLFLHQHDASIVAFNAWTALDLVALALLFWLMPRMTAVQMTTRYVIAPLIANLISLALLRPRVDVQSWIGLSLIAAGSVWLLIVPGRAISPDFFTFGRG